MTEQEKQALEKAKAEKEAAEKLEKEKEAAEAKAAKEKAEKEAAEKEKKAKVSHSEVEAYETYTKLHFDKLLRKGGKLKKHEEKLYEEVKKIVLKGKGPKATKTNTYRTSMQTVRLIEGIPCPQVLVDLFNEPAQKQLFS